MTGPSKQHIEQGDATAREALPVGVSPARLAWRRFRRNRTAVAAGIVLIFLYLITLFGSFIAPYDPAERNYAMTNHPPMLPRFVDETGRFHLRPFVYGMVLVDPVRQTWKFDLSKKYPIRFFVKGAPYKLWWIFPCDRHLFGVDPPGRICLLGTDSVGKDVFSRLIEGGKISLSIGLVGLSISLLIGMFVGALAGYYGGWWDTLIMRGVEFLLSIPTLYLIIALRAYFQTKGIFGIGGSQLTSTQMYVMIVVILAFIGWAGQARVVRGMVLAIKEQDFVTAERALGASSLRIIARHILPNTFSYVIVAATIAIPGYILGEVALSYLGVGIQEPQVSWGIMLEQAQSLSTIRNFPWLLFAPASVIIITVCAFNFLGDGLRDAFDPKNRT
ncbi:MAG: ABC transporter permease [Candidatus Hydrogenedentota bacterium]|jgi:peptide/nickel transport system permease protein|uniref:Oligopeptide transport system permease protein OppC n=1 Tax=Sumerlaea chitinivorans TaxID=2250252 RepID=A0A2Z4Y6C6_SUMC1|nr:Oligopeptide transport system permease protein OppC [Candidatus Sumerlaea chitinivorans]MCX7964095.1 ABC transporter permease [Candidatus Sumerlaea chitinivorans]RMH26202.1 MAG: ABC transporter permease [Candidatus Hydrogenedentota bacterium]